MAMIERIGFGQVEPNHLSAQRTAQIYAQLPAHIKSDTLTDNTIAILENGQFVKYDYVNKEVNFTGDGEWMLVFNEVKLYDTWRESYKDFAMINKNYTGEIMTPRVFKTNVGDLFTTNAVGGPNTSGKETYAGIDLNEGDMLKVDAATGFLISGGDKDADDMVWQVVKVYTMADGQPAVKVMRIK